MDWVPLQWLGCVQSVQPCGHVPTVEPSVYNVFYCRGQGVYKVENNVDMYRLWRHLSQTKSDKLFWVHGFRTNKDDGFISLDDYDGN